MTYVINEHASKIKFRRERLKQSVERKTAHIKQFDLSAFLANIYQIIELKEVITVDQITELMINRALETANKEKSHMLKVAASFYLYRLYKLAAINRDDGNFNENGYGDLYQLIKQLTTYGIYSSSLLASYTETEIREASKLIKPKRDQLFNYIGLLTLATRYLATDHEKKVYELPQERFMIIALRLMAKEEPAKRMHYVAEAYWALSNLYMTVATPTLANAGKSYGQLSSCFIDVVDDSLRGIYDNNTDIATLSKNGGGIGVYLGKIRGQGSAIKGFPGMSSGIIPWARQLNNTAVSVDQLGTRIGSIAIYLDIWHSDILAFLDLKLNNGDERLRTHDLFLGVCLPDLFLEKVEKRQEWYLFDPHEVRQVMGFSLEDFYDEEKGHGSFREKYALCVNNNNLSRKIVPAIDIMKGIMKSQLETGTPYMFYRDTANRANPNQHLGMIYCSNLCTEIMQNLSPTTFINETTENAKIIIEKRAGDFVVCNLSSINLGRAVPHNILERLIPIQVRMLDNVIDINTIPVPQARITNQKYRAIGLGTFGWHHLLALKHIRWESDEAVSYADSLYEKIAYLTISASHELAVEKGAYPTINGSDWENGRYFEKRDYLKNSQYNWSQLAMKIQKQGIRNGYLMAIAPNSTTAIIAGSTASIDPLFRKEYIEEKKNYRIPVLAPDLNEQTFWFYKNAHDIDQAWTLKQNAARLRHVDQGISLNLYVKNNIKAKELLDLHILAWSVGIKSTYYVRSTANEIAECEVCSS